MSRSLLVLAAAFVLAACQPDATRRTETSLVAVNAQAQHGFGPEISAEDFSAHVKVLSSDDFGGRAPGSAGEDKTVRYLQQQLERLGLKPGNHGSYFQTVPMVATKVDAVASKFRFDVAGQGISPLIGEQMVIGSHREQEEVKVADSPMIFVGYGVNAPEQHWNDYAGLDVRGKTVVMLINDPGFHVNDPDLFEGKRMTYYGRWTYKYEEAARQGAAAAIIIHDTAGAAYGWEVVKNSWGGEQFDLPASDDPDPRLPIQGWMTGETAEKLFAAAHLDLAALRLAANQRGFKPVALADARFSADLVSHIRRAQSRNVIGILPGSEHPDQAVMYSAHWDHLGTHADEPGDNIYNGAVDNGTGVAALLEMAEAFTVQTPRPKRSLVFLFDTLEESGLLGSKYYAAHPVIPLAKTVADINQDALVPLGPTHDFIIVGKGNSDLDDLMQAIIEKQGRVVTAESKPQNGSFFRSDHFSFAKAGVPAMDCQGGVDNIEHGRAWGEAMKDDYTAHRYHKAADNYDPNWDLRGIVQDLHAVYDLGKELADSDQWPNYKPGNAFRAARDKSRAGVQP
jgi:Zn-dependent M28 family amino/carboxypeptidase